MPASGCLSVVLFASGAGIAALRVWRAYERRREATSDRLSSLTSSALAPGLPSKTDLTADQLAPEARQAALLALLRKHDPAFQPALLLARLRLVVEQARAVRGGGADGLLRALVSDGLLPTLVTPHAVRSAHEETLTHAASFRAVVVTDVEESGPLQVVRARLTAATAQGQQLVTVWSLARRLDATTRPEGLSSGQCPSCGAALSLNAMARCGHCDVIVNSGLHDWVVTAVADAVDTQRWVEPVHDPDGVLRQDPALSRCFVEERACFAFWRWQHTLAQGSLSPLAGAATPEFVAHFAPTLEQAERFEDVDLRRVRLVALCAGAEHQSALVEVLLTAKTPRGREAVRLAFDLKRRAGATSPRPLGLSSARCGQCLGPQREDAGARCAWCGSQMPDAWYLDGLVPFAASDAAREAHEATKVSPRQQLYLLLLGVALADGKVSAEEQRVLDACARSWGLEPPTPEEAVRSKAWVTSARLRGGSDDALLLQTFASRVARAEGGVALAEQQAFRLLKQVLERESAARAALHREDRVERLGRLLGD